MPIRQNHPYVLSPAQPTTQGGQAVKTMLEVSVDFDPGVTDPESLASAMDRLLETALSTPGIFEDYGNPRLGEFFVACRGRSHTCKKSRKGLRHWAIYDLATAGLLSTELYRDYRQAVEVAAQVDDAIVVPIVIRALRG
jgi:hypothetical protein